MSDRYLLSGPVCYQAAVPVGKDPNEVIPGFALIPLKAKGALGSGLAN